MDHRPHPGPRASRHASGGPHGRKKMYASSAHAQQELDFRIVPVYPPCAQPSSGSAPTVRAMTEKPSQSMTRVAIIAAMPAELKPLVRGWQHELRNGVHLWRWRYDQGEWIAACAGAGVAPATRAFAEAERTAPSPMSSPPAGRARSKRALRRATPTGFRRHRLPHRGALSRRSMDHGMLARHQSQSRRRCGEATPRQSV